MQATRMVSWDASIGCIPWSRMEWLRTRGRGQIANM